MTEEDLETLARACRILAHEGHNDLTLGHLSLRADAPGRFWCKRTGIGLDEVTGPEDFVLLSFDGDKVSGAGQRPNEWPIHARILRARPDVNVVGHTHSPWATRLSGCADGWRPVANYGALFGGRLARFEVTSGLIDTVALGDELAAVLGVDQAILLRNHGAVFCGSSVQQATLTALWLERAAADAMLASASGMPVTAPSQDELLRKRSKTFAPAVVEDLWLYLCRQLEHSERGRSRDDPRAVRRGIVQ